MRFLAIGLGCLMALSVHAAAVNIENIRTWPAPDHTRIVLDVDRPVDYALFVLRDPDRVVIDLRGARLLKGVPDARPDDRLLARIRAAQRKRTGGRARDGVRVDLRVVLDMKQRVRPKSFLLKPNRKYGHRLVIDVYPADGGTDDAATARKRAADDALKGGREVVIAVDAGHGGEDPGAMTRSGIREKDVVLAIARALKRRIGRTPGMKAVMIRDGDYYVGLRRRTELARRHGADLLVSVHADSFRDPRVSGSSVYILSRRGASSEAARWLAEQENSSDFVGGVSIDDKDDLLASVLVDLQQTATLSASSEVGGRVLRSLGRAGRRHKRRVEQAGFLVLKSPDIPSILIETGFLTNPSDAKRLSNPKHQDTVARAVLDGILGYFDRNPPPGTTFASARRHTIASGETLSEIAVRYRVSVERLRSANRINGSIIRIGDVLRIPGRSDG
jgi:N-acetylmuramoyl-L-alanine amidase